MKQLTIEQFAEQANVSVSTVRSWILRGRIKPEHLTPPQETRIAAAALEYLTKGTPGRPKKS